MSWVRNPSETDPLMTQSQRKDFPPALERQVIDGGVREGRPEAPSTVGLTGILLIVLIVLLVAGIIAAWGIFFK